MLAWPVGIPDTWDAGAMGGVNVRGRVTNQDAPGGIGTKLRQGAQNRFRVGLHPAWGCVGTADDYRDASDQVLDRQVGEPP